MFVFSTRPLAVRQLSPVGGATTAPATGWRSMIRAMLTVKWGSPRTNALVPSSGSTRKNSGPIASGVPNSLACSSEITGTPGKVFDSRSRISSSARRSASVTGLSSALACTTSSERHSGRISRAASAAMSAS